MNTESPTAAVWRKSSYSTATGNCLELASTADGVAVRDSKNPDGPALRFTRAGLAAWISGCKAGEFDHFVR